MIQLIDTARFTKYDFGTAGNLKAYGTETAPSYDLHKISKVPVGMYVGKYDELATPKDAKWEADQMQSTVFYKEYAELDHDAFFAGKDMSYLNDLIDQLNTYNK